MKIFYVFMEVTEKFLTMNEIDIDCSKDVSGFWKRRNWSTIWSMRSNFIAEAAFLTFLFTIKESS